MTTCKVRIRKRYYPQHGKLWHWCIQEGPCWEEDSALPYYVIRRSGVQFTQQQALLHGLRVLRQLADLEAIAHRPIGWQVAGQVPAGTQVASGGVRTAGLGRAYISNRLPTAAAAGDNWALPGGREPS